MNAKSATCQSAGRSYWELAAFHRQQGKPSLSRHYAALAQVYYTAQRKAESEEESAKREKRGVLARLLG